MAAPTWLIDLTQTLADLSLVLAQANVQQGAQTQEKLDQLIAQGVAMTAEVDALNEALDAQQTKIVAEFDEIKKKVDDYQAAVEAGNSGAEEISALKLAIGNATERVNASLTTIGELSTAGDDVVPPAEPTPPAGEENTPPA